MVCGNKLPACNQFLYGKWHETKNWKYGVCVCCKAAAELGGYQALFLVSQRISQWLEIWHKGEAKLRGCCSHAVDSGMVHFLEKYRRFSSSCQTLEGSESMAQKRQSYGNKVFPYFLENPRKQLKRRRKEKRLTPEQGFNWKKSCLLKNLLLSHCHSLTLQTLHVTTTASPVLQIGNLRFLGQLSLKYISTWLPVTLCFFSLMLTATVAQVPGCW